MSKLSFRARAVDASKQMPIFLAEELPDLSEYASINRAVPQMPTGMEKDEEMELHLQQAISAQQRLSTGGGGGGGGGSAPEDAVIPIPKVSSDVKYYEEIYPADYKLPKQLIKVQAALSLEPEVPDYDLDSEDEEWLSKHGPKIDITPLQFERIMDTLEKQSEFKVITPSEAKLLLQEDDDILLSVYDYWLNKRYKAASQGKNLIPRVKIEKRDGTGAKHNPYVAFRRRAEKMQTRKNRRNDEESYEKILKLRHDLQKAVTLAEMVKRREKSKRELINLTLDIVEKRYVLDDFSEEMFSKICNEAKPSFKFSKHETGPLVVNSGKKPPVSPRKRKAPLTPSSAREDKGLVSREWLIQNAEEWNQPPASFLPSPASSTSRPAVVLPYELDKGAEDGGGRYVFKRIRGCRYYAPRSTPSCSENVDTPWPWEGTRRNATYFPTYLHSSSSSSHQSCSSASASSADSADVQGVNGLRFVGLARRRMGRGGRLILDRRFCAVGGDRYVSNCGGDEAVPSTSSESVRHQQHASDDSSEGRLYFRPSSPVVSNELEIHEYESLISTSGQNASIGTRQSAPIATVVGPNGGVLRLPMTIGSVIPPDCNFRRSSPAVSPSTGTTANTAAFSRNQTTTTVAVDNNNSCSAVQKQLIGSLEGHRNGELLGNEQLPNLARLHCLLFVFGV